MSTMLDLLSMTYSVTSRTSTNQQRTILEIFQQWFGRNRTSSDANSVYNSTVTVYLWRESLDWQDALAKSMDMIDDNGLLDRETFFLEFVHPYIRETRAFIEFVRNNDVAKFMSRFMIMMDNASLKDVDKEDWVQKASVLCIFVAMFLYFHPEVLERGSKMGDKDFTEFIEEEMQKWTLTERSFTHLWALFALNPTVDTLPSRRQLLQAINALIQDYEIQKTTGTDQSQLFRRAYALIAHDAQSYEGTMKIDGAKWNVEDGDAEASPWRSVADKPPCI